jgi:uncharacterized protein (TIGR02300 family)
VAKPELGTKRPCQNCGAKFFDLNKDPIVCPRCGTVFGAAGRPRAAAKEDVVSLDEVEAGEDKVPETAIDDVDGEDEGTEAEDDSFVEEEEEGEDDFSNLIDGDIAPDEEG